MAEIITMPRLSDTMEEGTVAKWLKKVGDSVSEGDILAEIETDKATMEFESFYTGTLLYIGVQEGETATVDATLAIIGEKGTDVEALLNKSEVSSQPTEQEHKDIKEEIQSGQKQPMLDTPSASGTVQNISSTDHGRLFISPLAKKIAVEKGIDITQINGTGENGRIVKKDVENITPLAKQPSGMTMPLHIVSGEEQTDDVPNSQMRKTIARRLSGSKFSAPHYYLTVELDMENAIAFRSQVNGFDDIKISFNDIVLKACASALRKHPQLNSSWTEQATRIYRHIHLGVAVAVEDGLLVPVLKFADAMSLSQIGHSVKDLAGEAREKKLTPNEMDGSTFTVSNLGMFGIQEFTSIINQPNSAILSVGAIVEKPVVKDGEIVVGKTMKVTLACDHRTVDGAMAAQFLQTLKNYVENPAIMLV